MFDFGFALGWERKERKVGWRKEKDCTKVYDFLGHFYRFSSKGV